MGNKGGNWSSGYSKDGQCILTCGPKLIVKFDINSKTGGNGCTVLWHPHAHPHSPEKNIWAAGCIWPWVIGSLCLIYSVWVFCISKTSWNRSNKWFCNILITGYTLYALLRHALTISYATRAGLLQVHVVQPCSVVYSSEFTHNPPHSRSQYTCKSVRQELLQNNPKEEPRVSEMND